MLQVSPFNQNNGTMGQLNLAFATGDVIALPLSIIVANEPLDLTGALVKMTIAFPTPQTFDSNGHGIVISDPASGQFLVNMTSTQTADFPAGTYPYDLWVESQASPPVETQYLVGNVTVTQSITAVP